MIRLILKQAEKNCPLLNNPQTDEIGILSEVAVRKKLYDEAKKYVELKLKNGYKIEDFENLDKRRTSVGLPPWRMHKEIQSLINKKYNLSN